MDALLSLDGILDAKTDIAKAEVYLLARPDLELTEKKVKNTCDDYGYGLRTYEMTSEKKWDELGKEDQ